MKYLVVIHPEDTVEIFRTKDAEKGKGFMIPKTTPIPDKIPEPVATEVFYKIVMDSLREYLTEKEK